jgi:hypothetical protein
MTSLSFPAYARRGRLPQDERRLENRVVPISTPG